MYDYTDMTSNRISGTDEEFEPDFFCLNNRLSVAIIATSVEHL